MYEEQKPFTLTEFCYVSSFLNHFMFKAIWNGLAGRRLFSYFNIASFIAHLSLAFFEIFDRRHFLSLLWLFDIQLQPIPCGSYIVNGRVSSRLPASVRPQGPLACQGR